MSLSSLILYFLFPQIYLLKRRALWSCLNTWNMYFHCLESFMSLSSSFSSSFSSNLLPQMQSPLNLFKYLKELFSLPVVFYDFVFLLFIFIFFKFTSSNAEPCGLVLIPEKAIFTTCSFLCLYLPLFHLHFPQIYLLKCRPLWTCLNTRRRYFHCL